MMMMQELPQERLLIAAMGVASAEASFEWARAYVKERQVRQLRHYQSQTPESF